MGTTSLWTAQAAKLIAENYGELNPDVAYVLGMLHDIVAKICITHFCPSKNINDI
ncbi:HDOD domain-containing protein [Clostridium sp. FP1]|uniref:HDOD domain-containing protein n=1 Tax=Clostridium sp. FP1 TaxID=2724076 RepID=UPI0029620743|nr:HDOD domain-containing protein [Clostridium sp. FP1]